MIVALSTLRVGIVLLLAAALLGLPAIVTTAPAASACTCADISPAAPRPPDGVLFEGRVLDGRDVVDSESVWTIEATRVLRGDVTRIQPVVADPPGSSCGLQLTVGEPYLISAKPDSRPGVLATGLCTATQHITDLTSQERLRLEQSFGPG